MLASVARLLLAGAAAAESTAAMARLQRRRDVFAAAGRRAVELERPLVVVGDPDAGMHTRMVRAYGCGDLCIDLNGCAACPRTVAADLTAGPVPGVADDSAVVFCSCVLEYVPDPEAAVREMLRVAGSPENLFVVFVDGWTLTAALYPGARFAGGRTEDGTIAMRPITAQRKAATGGALALLAALAFAG